MTADPGRARPEPVLCPNGHPNRPGTRICAVCRALIPPAATTTPPLAEPAPTPPDRGQPGTGKGDSWLLALLLLLLALTAVTLVLTFLYFYPIRRGSSYLATAAVVTMPAGASGVAAVATATLPPTAPATSPPATPLPATPAADRDASPTPVATITPLSTIVGVVLTPTLATTAEAALPPNLIQNGDFSQDWVNGWERATDGLNGTQVVEVHQSSGAPPRPLLAMSKTGAGALRVVQHVVLNGPATDLIFRGQLRLAGDISAGGHEGRAALLLLYEDADGQTLGASVWLDGSATTSALWGGQAPPGVQPPPGSQLPPFGPTTAPRIQAAAWQTVEIALGREFVDRLPGIDPDAVRRVTVVLALLGSDGCPPDGCVAKLEAAALSLSAGGLAP